MRTSFLFDLDKTKITNGLYLQSMEMMVIASVCHFEISKSIHGNKHTYMKNQLPRWIGCLVDLG